MERYLWVRWQVPSEPSDKDPDITAADEEIRTGRVLSLTRVSSYSVVLAKDTASPHEASNNAEVIAGISAQSHVFTCPGYLFMQMYFNSSLSCTPPCQRCEVRLRAYAA